MSSVDDLVRAATYPVPQGWDCHVHVFAGAGPSHRVGHYAPGDWPLAIIEALAERNGCGHLVLVQPSVYGTDNSLLLEALAASNGRHRGVMVVDATVTDAQLDAAHAVGVRGIRFNLVSPVGSGPEDFAQLAPRLRERGWHVQWYASAANLPKIHALHAGSGLVCVLDHLGGAVASLSPTHAAWDSLAALAEQGAWVKLSGWYRLEAVAPYDTLRANIQRVAAMFEGRTVWGSDWPHTWFAAEDQPAYADQMAVAREALSPSQWAATLEGNPGALYG